jgi:hypothetical protein
MKRTSGYAWLALFLMLAFCQFLSVPAIYAQEGGALNIDEVIKNTDPATATKAQIKTYFDKVKGQQARGEGVVVDVLPPGGWSREYYRVTILTPASKPAKGYNVVLYTTQDTLSDLTLNEKVSFEGKLHRTSPFKGGSVDIVGTYKKLEAK